MSDVRPIWLTSQDADQLGKIALKLENYGGLLGNPDPGFVRSIAEQVREAPAHPEASLRGAISVYKGNLTPEEHLAYNVNAVLRALAFPGHKQEQDRA